MLKPTKNRLYSLDALRGFDMFWIAGGAFMLHNLAQTTQAEWIDWLSYQCHHAEWNGFRFFDLIFPLFLFIAGVSFPFSLESRKRKGQSNLKIYRHIIQRGVVLVFLGLIYNGLLRFDFENLRFASVLGRIGLAWMFAALIVMNSRILWQVIWLLVILLGYYAAMMLIPVPGFGPGELSMEGSLAAYIDRLFLPGRLYLEVHDPEGIFSTIPAIATAILGMLTGQLLKINRHRLNHWKKLGIMFGSGIVLILLALLWDLSFPINKNLWTSSFVLMAAGISLLLLSFFYLLNDIWKMRSWAFPFVVIGLNPITIYLAQAGMIDFMNTADYFFGGLIETLFTNHREFWMAAAYFLVSWLFLYFLYKKRIFLKV
jgi:predicted acyltransferase